MAKGLDIRRRIKSIKSTKSITKAMEMVAASKMKKAQDQALKIRRYAEKALQILANISEKTGEQYSSHYLLKKKQGNRYLIFLLTSNRGLCGSLNANVIRKTLDFLSSSPLQINPTHLTPPTHPAFDFVTLGKKGRDALFRLKYNLKADFSTLGEGLLFINIAPVAKFLLDEYKNGNYDRVYIIYPHFVSTLVQKPIVKRVVPLGKDILASLKEILSKKEEEKGEEKEFDFEYIFEPDPKEVLDAILPKLIEMQIYQTILEAYASEQSARMIAMKNATEAAEDLIFDLTLAYNKMRQASITQEIAEIVGGVEALKTEEK